MRRGGLPGRWRWRPVHHKRRRRHPGQMRSELTLAEVPPGRRVNILGYCPGLSLERCAYLQAYGLSPGYGVHVLRQSPVTVVQIEHLELALETDLARQVKVVMLAE